MLDFGYASMDKFFALAPWIILFLIPALTMRSFSDEYKAGTIEVLFTLPLKDREIILGKFFASTLIVVFAIFPTLLYVITLASLSVIKNNVDTGAIIGSYIGLLFLCGAFTSIGLFASSISNNQVIAFLIAVFINFIVFAGFETISKIPVFDNGIDYILSQIGMQFHYDSISRGLIDSRDMVYFVSVIALFILATRIALGKRKWN
jgi:ABC-2 type transport system permease protein